MDDGKRERPTRQTLGGGLLSKSYGRDKRKFINEVRVEGYS